MPKYPQEGIGHGRGAGHGPKSGPPQGKPRSERQIVKKESTKLKSKKIANVLDKVNTAIRNFR